MANPYVEFQTLVLRSEDEKSLWLTRRLEHYDADDSFEPGRDDYATLEEGLKMMLAQLDITDQSFRLCSYQSSYQSSVSPLLPPDLEMVLVQVGDTYMLAVLAGQSRYGYYDAWSMVTPRYLSVLVTPVSEIDVLLSDTIIPRATEQLQYGYNYIQNYVCLSCDQ
jgi:hypothetical protein